MKTTNRNIEIDFIACYVQIPLNNNSEIKRVAVRKKAVRFANRFFFTMNR